jgi:acetyl esterase/lipase
MHGAGAFLVLGFTFLAPGQAPAGGGAKDHERLEDVIYGRKDGMALTMDVLTPRAPNGAAVIWPVSNNWLSRKEDVRAEAVSKLLARGYTVFAVLHGSQPRYTVPEAIEDVRLGVGFVRRNAKRFGIDANRIGAFGFSSGGHLALMAATEAVVEVPRTSLSPPPEPGVAAAVACFFPFTDFMNFGQERALALGKELLRDLVGAVTFLDFDPVRNVLVPVEDAARIGRQISPVNSIASGAAPTLIIHGDRDTVVPYQQAELMARKLEQAKVPFRLVTREGKAHGWDTMYEDVALCADWFDEHLRPRSAEEPARKE